MYEICKDNNCSDNNLSKIAIVRQIFFIGSLFLGAVVPLITITIVNMMIVKVIVQRNRAKTSLNQIGINTVDNISNKVHATRIMLMLSVTFVLCHLIMLVCLVVLPAVIDEWTSPVHYGLISMLSRIGVFFKLFNHASNFLFYFVSGTKFRDDLQALMLCSSGPSKQTEQ